METLNPFDDPQQQCVVVQNAQCQYSLWPAFSPIPTGWITQFGPAGRTQCDHWLETHWIDMRPAALTQP